MARVHQWIAETPVLENIRKQLNLSDHDFQEWLPQALVKSNAAMINQGCLVNLD